MDYRLTNSDNLFARFVVDRGNFTDPWVETTICCGFGDVEHSPNLYFTTEEKHNWTHIVNSVHLSYIRTYEDSANNAYYPALIFVPGLGDGLVGITGLSPIGPTPGNPATFIQNKGLLADDVTLIKGAHTLAFGFGVGWNKDFGANAYGSTGYYVFNSFQQFLTGQPFLYLGPTPGETNYARWFGQKTMTPYINDDWKISRRLTMNVGLRYEFSPLPTCPGNDCYNIVGNPLTATWFTPTPRLFATNPSIHNFDPRIGFAYDPFNNHKTSIRAGFALFHDVIMPSVYTNGYNESYPWVTGTSLALPFIPQFLWPTFPVPIPTGGTPSPGPLMSYSQTSTPYSEQWNINVQRELPGGAVLQVGYLGSHGVHLFMIPDLNAPLYTYVNGVQTFNLPRPNPNFSDMGLILSTSDSSYNSLQVNLTRQFSRHWQVQANYTYATCTDIADGIIAVQSQGTPVEDPFDPNLDRGPCGFVSTHVFHANAVGTLPFHGNRWVKGWQLSAIVSVNTGLPFSPSVGFDNSGLGAASYVPTDRPYMAPGYTCNKSLVTGNPNDWFNTGAFVLPAPDTLGNAPRNCLLGPAQFEPDFSVSKETNITERVQVQFRAEFFNIFNHTNFAMPGTAAGSPDAPYNQIFTSPAPGETACYGSPGTAANPCLSPSAGVITTTETSSRQIQFGVKFIF
jgi:hypothetical protein